MNETNLTMQKEDEEESDKKEEQELQDTPFFKQILMAASELVVNRFRILKLIGQAYKKLMDPANGKSLQEEVVYQLKLFLRMVKAIVTQKYKHFPAESLAKVVAALLYFVIFADLIPDFIPFLGFTDDALIIAWVYNSVKEDLDAYEEWESTYAVSVED